MEIYYYSNTLKKVPQVDEKYTFSSLLLKIFIHKKMVDK